MEYPIVLVSYALSFDWEAEVGGHRMPQTDEASCEMDKLVSNDNPYLSIISKGE